MTEHSWVHAGKQLSEPQRRMLTIVAAAELGITARTVAEKMWPRSESWGNATPRGRRVGTGQGIQMRAGVMLKQLQDAGLVHPTGRSTTRWQATAAGCTFLEEGRLDGGQGELL